MKKMPYTLALLLLLACNQIETGNSLQPSEIAYLQKIKLLAKDETIYKFYSQHTFRLAGNFFTDKRMASYWFDEFHKERSTVSFAWYRDISRIDTVYFAGSTYTPYMLVTKSDGKQFKVHVDGKQHEVKAFFEDAIKVWQLHHSSATK